MLGVLSVLGQALELVPVPEQVLEPVRALVLGQGLEPVPGEPGQVVGQALGRHSQPQTQPVIQLQKSALLFLCYSSSGLTAQFLACYFNS